MSFLKEFKYSFKEGMDETVTEFKEEQKSDERTEFFSKLKSIPYEEQFVMAIVAPFRTSFFQDCFTVSSGVGGCDDDYPMHLFSFAKEGLLNEKEKKQLMKAIKHDFSVRDRDSAVKIIFNRLHRLSDKFVDEDYNPLAQCDLWRMSELAYLVISATELNYISKKEAFGWLESICKAFCRYMGKENSKNPWDTFRIAFLEGNEILQSSKERHAIVLNKSIDYLHIKPGSPWNIVPFEKPL